MKKCESQIFKKMERVIEAINSYNRKIDKLRELKDLFNRIIIDFQKTDSLIFIHHFVEFYNINDSIIQEKKNIDENYFESEKKIFELATSKNNFDIELEYYLLMSEIYVNCLELSNSGNVSKTNDEYIEKISKLNSDIENKYETLQIIVRIQNDIPKKQFLEIFENSTFGEYHSREEKIKNKYNMKRENKLLNIRNKINSTSEDIVFLRQYIVGTNTA